MMRFAAVLVLGTALVSLSACGFRPLYGTASLPQGAEIAFAGVRIDPIRATNDSDRIGYLVNDAVTEALHRPGTTAPIKHVLKIVLADERRGLAIQDDASITRYNYRLSADWSLMAVGSETVLASGRAETTASYNVVDQQYATLVARRDAEERAAREVAEQIKVRVAVALSTPTPTAP